MTGIPALTPDDPIVGASTVTGQHGSQKVGSGGVTLGSNRTIAPLDKIARHYHQRR